MFSRRTPLPVTQKIREAIWPSMGWGRFLMYIKLRLLRLPDTNRSIATGMAFGAAVSFTPLPGIHILTAGFLTWACRGNVIASVIGTLVGNPWTIPLMWWAAYEMGQKSFHLFGLTIAPMPDGLTWNAFITEITTRPMDMMVPWATGGFLMMVLSWPIFYIVFYRLVRNIRRTYKRKN